MDNQNGKDNKKMESPIPRAFRGYVFFSSSLICTIIVCLVIYLKGNNPEVYKYTRSWYFNNLSVSDINTEKLINQVSEAFSTGGITSFKMYILDILCSLTS